MPDVKPLEWVGELKSHVADGVSYECDRCYDDKWRLVASPRIEAYSETRYSVVVLCRGTLAECLAFAEEHHRKQAERQEEGR